MHLVARQDIPEGQEILLSYGDRNNDDFFLHYGFVPLRNPHDDAVLFQDLTDALDWHYEHFKPEVRCAVLCCAALCCAVRVLQLITASPETPCLTLKTIAAFFLLQYSALFVSGLGK